MSLKTFFRPHEVDELRASCQSARDATQLPPNLPDGWQMDRVDSRRVLRAFEDLWLEPNITIHLFHHVSPAGAATVAAAYPSGTNRDPRDWPPYREGFAPPGGLEVMEHIGAEPGGWSFLAASIFARELEETGATGAHARWSKHRLLDGPPQDLVTDEPEFWTRDAPDEFRPHVIEDNNGTRVRFFTARSSPLRIYRHDDTYASDDFDATRRVRLVGREKTD